MNKYAENKLAVLRISLSHKKQFSIDDVCEVLGLKRSSALWLVSNLSRAGRIARVGRGIYSFDAKAINYRIPRLGDEIQKATDRLRNEGVSFVLTGLDILLPFVQHQPSRILHLIYAASGAGSWAQSILKEFRLTPVLEPTLQEAEKVLDIITDDSELVILREKSNHFGANNSVASLERAFVDLYFETTRELIPFSTQEVAYIFVNMHASILLNGSTMLRYAHERMIEDEIRDILNFAKKERAPEWKRPSNNFVKTLEAIS